VQKAFATMYIRNAQGQLMWIPPQGYNTQPPPPALPTLQALQQNMRQQMQRDEWAQFNAPPAQDNLYFSDDVSHYEGTPSSGFQQVAPSMAHMVHRGQQPFNPMNNPPVPQVLNSSPMLMSPRPPNPAQFRGPPSVVGGPSSFRGPPSVVGPSRAGPPSVVGVSRGLPSVVGPSPRGPPSVVGPLPRGPPSVVGPSAFRGPPSVVGFGGPPSVVGTSENFVRRGPPSVVVETPENFESSENFPLSPLHEEIKLVEEEFVPMPQVTCMNTIFGSSLDMYGSPKNHRSRKVALMNCNALNVSISSDDDEELGRDSLSYTSHRAKHRNLFQCNGVRGPGKRFDYFYETAKSDSTDSEGGSKSTASSETEDNEKLMDDSVDAAFQMNNMRISQRKPDNNVKTNHVTSPRVSAPRVTSPRSSGEDTLSTGGAVAEEDDSIDDQSGVVVDQPPMRRDYARHTRTVASEESVEQVLTPRAFHPKAEYFRDETRDQEDEHRGDIVETRDEEDEYVSYNNAARRRTEQNSVEDRKEKVTNYFAAKNYPTFNRHIAIREDNFPSFDEPDFPSFDEPANPSDGENDQQNANIYYSPRADKISVSKRVMSPRETKVEMPLRNSQVMN